MVHLLSGRPVPAEADPTAPHSELPAGPSPVRFALQYAQSGEPTAVTHPSPYAPTASHAMGPLAAT